VREGAPAARTTALARSAVRTAVLTRLAAEADADTIAAAIADAAYTHAGQKAVDDSGVVVIRVLPP